MSKDKHLPKMTPTDSQGRASQEWAEIKAALAVLDKWAAPRYEETGLTAGRGRKLGAVIYGHLDFSQGVELAHEVLEQNNAHLAAACISAIHEGEGKVRRRGKTLTITLPEWWEKI